EHDRAVFVLSGAQRGEPGKEAAVHGPHRRVRAGEHLLLLEGRVRRIGCGRAVLLASLTEEAQIGGGDSDSWAARLAVCPGGLLCAYSVGLGGGRQRRDRGGQAVHVEIRLEDVSGQSGYWSGTEQFRGAIR